MAYPLPVVAREMIVPAGFPTNIAAAITPFALHGFDYVPGYTFTKGELLRVLNTAGAAWWLADHRTGYGGGGYGRGKYGEAAGVGKYGGLRYGRGKYGSGR